MKTIYGITHTWRPGDYEITEPYGEILYESKEDAEAEVERQTAYLVNGQRNVHNAKYERAIRLYQNAQAAIEVGDSTVVPRPFPQRTEFVYDGRWESYGVGEYQLQEAKRATTTEWYEPYVHENDPSYASIQPKDQVGGETLIHTSEGAGDQKTLQRFIDAFNKRLFPEHNAWTKAHNTANGEFRTWELWDDDTFLAAGPEEATIDQIIADHGGQ